MVPLLPAVQGKPEPFSYKMSFNRSKVARGSVRFFRQLLHCLEEVRRLLRQLRPWLRQIATDLADLLAPTDPPSSGLSI
jgi:hypothetical protein